MITCPICEIDACAPCLVKRVRGCTSHAWQRLDAFELAHRRCWQNRLNRRAQTFFVNRPGETACKPHSRLLKRHDLEAVATVARRFKPSFPHCEAAMDDKC